MIKLISLIKELQIGNISKIIKVRQPYNHISKNNHDYNINILKEDNPDLYIADNMSCIKFNNYYRFDFDIPWKQDDLNKFMHSLKINNIKFTSKESNKRGGHIINYIIISSKYFEIIK